jgi:RNA polymerase sigma factor (sigma-70 family)
MAPRAAQLVHQLRRLAAAHVADPAPDAELLERFICRRDEAAFAVLVARHGPMVLRLCRRVLGDAHAAEDCCQATFLVLARRAATVRRRAALVSWLHGVAFRVARKARAAGSRRPPGERHGADEAPADPRPDPLTLLTARELLTALDEEVRRLPEVYRLPVILCCVEGRTREEAARQLGWTSGSVKGRLERGRARLHAGLRRRGLTLSAALAAAELSRAGAAVVTAPWVLTMARAAARFAAGEAVPAEAVSVRAVALTNAFLEVTVMTRLKIAVALFLMLLGSATGVLAYRALAQEPAGGRPGVEGPAGGDRSGPAPGGLPGGGPVVGGRTGLPGMPGGGERPGGRPRWEYKAISLAHIVEMSRKGDPSDRITEGLNRMGNQGWELVAIDPVPNNSTYLFKRLR